MHALEGILRRDYFTDLPPFASTEGEDFREMSLQDFQSSYTTEDDSSFNKLLGKLNSERKKRYKQKYSTDYNLITLSNSNTSSAIEFYKEFETESITNDSIRPSNTRLLTTLHNVELEDKDPQSRKSIPKPAKRSFVPMTPQNESNVKSPAARNLLRSIRSRAISKESPFGGSTPQRKPPK